MGNNLKFNSSVCTTREQSQRLLELGLKPETADCYNREEDYGYSNWIGKPSLHSDVPAWSLHRLLYCLMPNSIKVYYLAVYSGYVVTYDSLCESRYEVCKEFNESLNIYDNIIDCIEWLISEGYFNKEYLKQ
jgi:hypothetical protein